MGGKRGGGSTRLLEGLVLGGEEENRGGEGGQKWPNMDLCCNEVSRAYQRQIWPTRVKFEAPIVRRKV